ncbi:unnamed protein product [Schistosoma curassoni]|uniref:MT domain-containing protein n=1 Tax=Schistosoma curassoni TaxID=6186 RepID=A0A183KKE4_9TREM|nr:unnamed protein product [Schistosoma curassoni]
MDETLRGTPLDSPDIKAACTDLLKDITPPTTEEIRMVIRQTKCEKAAEPDNVTAGALKSNIGATANMLYVIFKKIWEEEQVLTD